METWDAIRARRNVRQYTDQPIAHEDLERICEAGRRSPSAGNWQPWNFVVVTDRAQLMITRISRRSARASARHSLTVRDQPWCVDQRAVAPICAGWSLDRMVPVAAGNRTFGAGGHSVAAAAPSPAGAPRADSR